MSEYENFIKGKDRLDTLLYSQLSNKAQFFKLWSLIRKLLLLSNSQAFVERGFSVNLQVEVETFIYSPLTSWVGGNRKVGTRGECLSMSSLINKSVGMKASTKTKSDELEKSTERSRNKKNC